MSERETRATIDDFGDQWVRFTDNSGYYGSRELFSDIVEPLLTPESVRGCRIADIGSGTGRIVQMLLDAGAAHVTAIEPSRAYGVLAPRFAAEASRVSCHNVRGESVADYGPFDYVFSIGVLHHIPEPGPVVEAALQSLRPGGHLLVWLYGLEGNRAYLALVRPLRALTIRLPDRALDLVVRLLDLPLRGYIGLCRALPLPMRDYMRNVIGKMAPDKRRLIIFDQLNPAYAKYYTEQQARELLEHAGFSDVRTYHRHGYSWAVTGTKP